MSDAAAFPARLGDAEWAVLEPLVPALKSGGRPAKYTRRALLDAILYAVRQGCTWRALPPDLPHWNTAFWYFRRWQQDGTWGRIEDALRRAVRVAEGRAPEPSAGIAEPDGAGDGAAGAAGLRRGEKKPPASSGTSAWTPSGWSGDWRSRPRTWPIVRAPGWR